MIKKFSYTDNYHLQLSPHFKAYEFASVEPLPYNVKKIYNDTILIDTDLIDKLELLMSLMAATTCYISSGYRTVEHDIKVGGNGKGQHTLGRAVDCAFYINKRPIDTRIVSLFAMACGFNGIARISDSYIHLDTRENSKYYGDETKGNSTVTSNFFDYFNFLL